jgi:hypothetical protein
MIPMDRRDPPRRGLLNLVGDIVEAAAAASVSQRGSVLTEMLQDENPTVVWAALREIGRGGQADMLPAVEPLLSHRDVTIRRAAEDVMRQITQRAGAMPPGARPPAPPPPPPPPSNVPLRPRPAYVPPPVAPVQAPRAPAPPPLPPPPPPSPARVRLAPSRPAAPPPPPEELATSQPAVPAEAVARPEAQATESKPQPPSEPTPAIALNQTTAGALPPLAELAPGSPELPALGAIADGQPPVPEPAAAPPRPWDITPTTPEGAAPGAAQA